MIGTQSTADLDTSCSTSAVGWGSKSAEVENRDDMAVDESGNHQEVIDTMDSGRAVCTPAVARIDAGGEHQRVTVGILLSGRYTDRCWREKITPEKRI